jgi:phosphonate transport system ATP-binding protein
MNMAAVQIQNMYKSFQAGKPVLKDINLSVAPGEMVGLIGASGSGKSTLIRMISGLETMDRRDGQIALFGKATQAAGRRTAELRRMRSSVGIIFQQFNLVGRLSLLKNVLIGRLAHIPCWKGMLSLFPRHQKIKAMQALERVNMVDYAHQRASTLSGGQQQRGAIARALTQEAKLILADEPIASLDPASSDLVMDLLSDINRQDQTTVIVSLHQFEVARERCRRIVALQEGRIIYDGPSEGIREDDLSELYGVENTKSVRLPEEPIYFRKAI